MAGQRNNMTLESRKKKYGYMFTAPFLIGCLIGIVYPIIVSVVYSFGEIIPTTTGYDIRFVGWENFKFIFTVDASFNKILIATLRSTISNVPVVVIFSFFLASVLNGRFIGRSFARTVLFLPLILFSDIVVKLMNKDVIGDNLTSRPSSAAGEFSGVFAGFLEKMQIGGGISSLLTSAVDNIGNLLAMSVIPTVIILAGLQSISQSVYEASYVEGATPWEVFWKISLPIVSPMILVSVIYCIIDSFTSISNTVIIRIREECFEKLEFGIGSAMAWAYLLGVLIIVAAVYALVNRFVSYSD